MSLYSFQQQLFESSGFSDANDVSKILRAALPGICTVTRAHQTNDRSGTDWWAEHVRGTHLSIDDKVALREDCRKWNKDDLALETWSVIGKKIGWTRDETKRTDFILFRWSDTLRWELLPFLPLCAVMQRHWQEWRVKAAAEEDAFRLRIQHTSEFNGYDSEVIFVPRRVVWRAIFYESSGVLSAGGRECTASK